MTCLVELLVVSRAARTRIAECGMQPAGVVDLID